ncbi:hypothetical protein BDK51DRAFT_40439 [Blyttiomyces helicus]|uniref:Uncharacterized protein n=1 Tax=Blyttiomyces helicus TaxID=388810 RepID=A0A4V1IPZ6_9FUNG|nr:hypothetical protein BDK51DRAFT_40439 [Blyttiomyces helicus]|eukprot:RKO84787.1 hypothetical protein BDK51DRAFT_40439 [Blyttiomyces helicus]
MPGTSAPNYTEGVSCTVAGSSLYIWSDEERSPAGILHRLDLTQWAWSAQPASDESTASAVGGGGGSGGGGVKPVVVVVATAGAFVAAAAIYAAVAWICRRNGAPKTYPRQDAATPLQQRTRPPFQEAPLAPPAYGDYASDGQPPVQTPSAPPPTRRTITVCLVDSDAKLQHFGFFLPALSSPGLAEALLPFRLSQSLVSSSLQCPPRTHAFALALALAGPATANAPGPSLSLPALFSCGPDAVYLFGNNLARGLPPTAKPAGATDLWRYDTKAANWSLIIPTQPTTYGSIPATNPGGPPRALCINNTIYATFPDDTLGQFTLSTNSWPSLPPPPMPLCMLRPS